MCHNYRRAGKMLTLPRVTRSLWQILGRLEHGRYDTQAARRRTCFSKPSERRWHQHRWLERQAPDGRAVLMRCRYRHWFDRQPPCGTRHDDQAWGEPEKSTVMLWRDPRGRRARLSGQPSAISALRGQPSGDGR